MHVTKINKETNLVETKFKALKISNKIRNPLSPNF